MVGATATHRLLRVEWQLDGLSRLPVQFIPRCDALVAQNQAAPSRDVNSCTRTSTSTVRQRPCKPHGTTCGTVALSCDAPSCGGAAGLAVLLSCPPRLTMIVEPPLPNSSVLSGGGMFDLLLLHPMVTTRAAGPGCVCLHGEWSTNPKQCKTFSKRARPFSASRAFDALLKFDKHPW